MSLTQATPRRDAVIALANGIRESLLAVTPTLIAEVDMRGGQELAPLGDGPTLAERAASINKHIDLYSRAEGRAHTYRLRAGTSLSRPASAFLTANGFRGAGRTSLAA